MSITAIFSFIIALLFNYVFIKDDFIVNVSLAIFGSSLLAALVALITYFANKKIVLKEQGDILIKLLNKFSKYRYNPNKTNDTARDNLKILVDARYLVFEELSSKRWEYCPFFRNSKQDAFLFSSVKYFVNFYDSINRKMNILNNMQDLGFDNKLAQENIAKIDELIYLKTEESYNLQGEISSQKFNNTIKENLTAYLNEYIQVINGKHKGEYHSIDQSVLSKNKERKKMIKNPTTKTIYKIVILFLILISSIWLILTNQYEVFISTVVIGALVGLFTSFTISNLFEKEKEKNRQNIRTVTLSNFIYSCSNFLISLELWYKEFSKMDNYCILENSELVTYKIKEIRDKLRVNGDQPISDEYKNLISEYIYSIPPIYTAHSSLNNQQLLLSEVLTVEEYNYFHNYIYNDIINHFSNMKKQILMLTEQITNIYLRSLTFALIV